MSQWQRGICKIGLTIQGKGTGTKENWLSVPMSRASRNAPNWLTPTADRYKLPAPMWASSLLRTNITMEKTSIWGYSRYPYSTGGGTYELSYNMFGQSYFCATTFALMGIWRASDKGIDQGASYGYVYWRELQIWDTNGVLMYDFNDDNVAEIKFSEANMKQYDLQRTIELQMPRPIGNVYVKVDLTPNVYAAHDVGDRSEAAGFNPSIPFGAYHPRNLNEISSDKASTLLDAGHTYVNDLMPPPDYGDLVMDSTFAIPYADFWKALWYAQVPTNIVGGYHYRVEFSWPEVGWSKVLEFDCSQAWLNSIAKYKTQQITVSGKNNWGNFESVTSGGETTTARLYLFGDQPEINGADFGYNENLTSFWAKEMGNLYLNADNGQFWIGITNVYYNSSWNGTDSGTETHLFVTKVPAPHLSQHQNSPFSVKVYRRPL